MVKLRGKPFFFVNIFAVHICSMMGGYVFTAVCLFTRGGEYPNPVTGPVYWRGGLGQTGQAHHQTVEQGIPLGCKRYISCSHAGGLSCYILLLSTLSHATKRYLEETELSHNLQGYINWFVNKIFFLSNLSPGDVFCRLPWCYRRYPADPGLGPRGGIVWQRCQFLLCLLHLLEVMPSTVNLVGY